MGIFDAVKNRLGRGNQDEYYEDDQYYDDDYREDDYEEEYDEGASDDQYDDNYDDQYDDRYDDRVDAPRGTSSEGSRRASRSSVFDGFTPLVSMSDVRSQELPAYSETSHSYSGAQNRTQRSRGAGSEIKTSLPYINDSRDASATSRGRYETREDASHAERINAPAASSAALEHVYSTQDSSDPLLKRHSLSNTGDFAATSPVYYASRSGVGHVRPVGQARRTHKFREAVVIRPNDYAEAEQVAINLRRGNAVVLVLSQTRPELAKRILDFSFGAAAVSEGQVDSIGERIYALTTEHPLTQTEIELLQARGVI